MAGSEVGKGVLPSHELLIHNLLYNSVTKANIKMSFSSAVVCRKKIIIPHFSFNCFYNSEFAGKCKCLILNTCALS